LPGDPKRRGKRELDAAPCFPDEGVFAIANLGFPVKYRHHNEKSATGNNERKVRSILLLGHFAPTMKDKMQQAIEASQQEVIIAAEQKLGRSLSDADRRGIQSIGSLMMLESCYQFFSSSVSTQAEVVADLAHFTKQAQRV
jgi:hypothetical protein